MVSRLNGELWLRRKDTRNFPQVPLRGGYHPYDLCPLPVPCPCLFRFQVPDPKVLFRHLLAFLSLLSLGFVANLNCIQYI